MTVGARSAAHDLWKVVLGWGTLTLILGIVMLARPEKSIVVAGALLATYLVISGIAEMVFRTVLDSSVNSRIPLFVTGALSLALGLLAFHHFGYAAAVLLLALSIGAVFIFEGVSAIALALEDPSLPDRGWYVFLGIIEAIAGLVMLAWPFRSLATATVVAGVWLVAIGGADILWALRARRAIGGLQRTAELLTHTSARSATRGQTAPARRGTDQRNRARDITTR